MSTKANECPNQLRSFREAKGWSTAELGVHAGKSKNSICGYEVGSHAMNHRVRNMFALLFICSPDAFKNSEPEPPASAEVGDGRLVLSSSSDPTIDALHQILSELRQIRGIICDMKTKGNAEEHLEHIRPREG